MKRLSVLLFLILTSSLLSAQDYVLKDGTVFAYDEVNKGWSYDPLPMNTVLHSNDSIKATTPFTVVLSRNLRNARHIISGKWKYNFVPYENGVRLSSNLREVRGGYRFINLNVITQGANAANQIEWIYQNPLTSSPIDVYMTLEDLDGTLITSESEIQSSQTLYMSLYNREEKDVYVYLLFSDENNTWDLFEFTEFNDKGETVVTGKVLGLSSHCSYSQGISFTPPPYRQELLMICTYDILSPRDIELFLSRKTEAIAPENQDVIIGHSFYSFTLLK